MNLLSHNHFVTVSWTQKGLDLRSIFTIGAIPLDAKQALKIARLLFPRKRNLKVLSHH